MLRRVLSSQNCRFLDHTFKIPSNFSPLNCSNESVERLQLQTQTPLAISIRNRKPNVKRPNIPCKEKAHVLALTWAQYEYPLAGMTAAETCLNRVKHEAQIDQTQNLPLEEIWAREMLEEIESSPVFVVIHRHRSTREDLFNMRVQFKRSNMKYIVHSHRVSRIALKGTKYESLSKLFIKDCTASAISYDRDISKILKLDRKLPYANVLACVLDGQILSKADMQRVAQLPELPLLRAQLCQALTSHQSALSQALTAHQTELSGALQRHADGTES